MCTRPPALLHAMGGCSSTPAADEKHAADFPSASSAMSCLAAVSIKVPAGIMTCTSGHPVHCPVCLGNLLLPKVVSWKPCCRTWCSALPLALPNHSLICKNSLSGGTHTHPILALQDITESAKDTLLQEEVLSVLIEMGAVEDLIEAARQSGRTGKKRIETHLMQCGGVQSNGELPEGQQLNRQQVRGSTASSYAKSGTCGRDSRGCLRQS